MRPLRLRIHDSATGHRIDVAFEISPVVMGRDELADLWITDGQVSYLHGIFHFDDTAAAYIEHRKVANRGVLDGTAVIPDARTEIKPGATLVIGTLRLIIDREAVESDEAATPATGFDTRLSPRGGTRVHEAVAPQARGTRAVRVIPAAPAPLLPHAPRPSNFPGPLPPPTGPSPAAAVATVRLSTPAKPPSVLAAMGARSVAETPTQVLPTTPASGAITAAERPLAAAERDAIRDLHHALAPLLQRPGDLWPALEKPLRAGLDQLPAMLRHVALEQIAHSYPWLSESPGFRRFLEDQAVDVSVPAAAGAAALAAVRAVAQALGVRPPTTVREVQTFVARTQLLLETHHAGLAMLRRGQEGFRRDWLGTAAPIQQTGPLSGAHTAQEITARLYAEDFSPEAAAEAARREHLRLRVHHYAVLRALPHAARQVVRRMNPQQIARELLEQTGRFWRLLPWARARRTVLALEARYRDLTEEPEHLDAAMLGSEFVRAYNGTVSANEHANTSDEPQKRR